LAEKLLTLLSGADRETLVEQIKPQLQALKKFTFGKQINAVRLVRVKQSNGTNMAQIEKLIFNNATTSQTASPLESALTTPPLLTTGAQSPDSSATPSTSSAGEGLLATPTKTAAGGVEIRDEEP